VTSAPDRLEFDLDRLEARETIERLADDLAACFVDERELDWEGLSALVKRRSV
jgi:hypothetical protein